MSNLRIVSCCGQPRHTFQARPLYVCRADYPSDAQLSQAKKPRKRKKRKPVGWTHEISESEESTGLVLQLQELGLPSAFGTSKASINVMDAAVNAYACIST